MTGFTKLSTLNDKMWIVLLLLGSLRYRTYNTYPMHHLPKMNCNIGNEEGKYLATNLM